MTTTQDNKMNPLIEFYKVFRAKGYVWSGTDKEFDHATELAEAATEEQQVEFIEYIKEDIAGEHDE